MCRDLTVNIMVAARVIAEEYMLYGTRSILLRRRFQKRNEKKMPIFDSKYEISLGEKVRNCPEIIVTNAGNKVKGCKSMSKNCTLKDRKRNHSSPC